MAHIQTEETTANQSALVAVKDTIVSCGFESPTDGSEWGKETPVLPMIQNSKSFPQIQYTPSLHNR